MFKAKFMTTANSLVTSYFLPHIDSLSARPAGVLKAFQFGSGEYHLQLATPVAEHVEILFRYQGDQSMMQLLLLTDALRRHGAKYIDLLIPYFPGARQDRVCNEGEALSVKVYADLINQQQYQKVCLFDPHSDVVVALLNQVQVIKNHQFIQDILSEPVLQAAGSELVLISPDAGSNKKIFDLSSKLGGIPVVRADKIRDVRTGAIVDTEVFSDDLTGKTALIVDDICAGGRTFIELAKKLKAKGCGKIILAVSHFEGRADVALLAASGIDALYTTNSLTNLAQSEFLRIKNIWRFMPVQGDAK
jgi:ribose-phosphate pyrophosphokinase